MFALKIYGSDSDYGGKMMPQLVDGNSLFLNYKLCESIHFVFNVKRIWVKTRRFRQMKIFNKIDLLNLLKIYNY